MGENTRPSSKENSSECGKERRTKLRNNRFAKCKNSNIWRRTWNRWGKKTKGRKRHIVVDVLGCLLSVNVHAANVHDTKSGIVVAKQAFKKYSSIKKFCADAGYRGTFVNDIKNQISLDVDISEKIKPHSWQNIPWRWVVERTFSWLNHSRRLSKDYEISPTSSTTMIIISHIHTLLCRL